MPEPLPHKKVAGSATLAIIIPKFRQELQKQFEGLSKVDLVTQNYHKLFFTKKDLEPVQQTKKITQDPAQKKKVGSVSTTLPRMKQGGPFWAQNQKTGKPLPLLAGQLVLVELLDEGHQGLEVGGYGLAVRMA